MLKPTISQIKEKTYPLDAAAETKIGSTGLHFTSKTLQQKTEGSKQSHTLEEQTHRSDFREDLGNASLVLRSQTTLFASTFHALMPPSAVPMRSFCHEEPQHLKVGISNLKE